MTWAHISFCFLLAILSYANAQSTASCSATVANQGIFTTQLIQTIAGVTTVSVNVTNLTNQPVYYVQFSMDNNADTEIITPTVASSSGTYTGHYEWTLSTATTRGGSTVPAIDWLRFTPTSGATGVTCSRGICGNTQMESGSPTTWSWDVFTFQVTNYNPTFPWVWQMVAGANYVTVGPLDMSLCYCGNCDAGFFQRDVLPCNLGYVDAAGDYTDTTNSLTTALFNENIILYSYAINGNWLEMFYTDEHPMMLGISQVITPSGTTNYNVLASSVAYTPTCVTAPTPIYVGSTIFDPTNAQANVDLCGPENSAFQCTNTPTANPPLYCPRPMPPVVFITDITNLATNRSGDWQFGGPPYLPQKVCGMWKTGSKTVTSQNADGTWAFSLSPDADPNCSAAPNCGNAIGTISWNLGPGSDPLPFIPNFSTAVQEYGTEVAWDINSLGLNPSHNYRFQFMVHDGDQSHLGITGGDVGQACIIATAACPAGFTGSTCTNCDLIPAPYDGSYTWFCYPTTNTSSPYNLIKIPTAKLTASPYDTSGGFVPGKILGTATTGTTVDSEGYTITCNCQRITYPCPVSCCGRGLCNAQNGTCSSCTAPPAGNIVNATTCCLIQLPPPPPPPPVPAPINAPPPVPEPAPAPPPPPPPPPCYNNGSYCNSRGICNASNVCACTAASGYTGKSCNIPIPVPPVTCKSLSVSSCDSCQAANTAINLNCIWCTSTTNLNALLTNGSCVDAVTGGCSANNTLAGCNVPTVTVPPPCPDNCTGNGNCVQNQTCLNNPSSHKRAVPTHINCTQYCSCFTSYSGINCGNYESSNTAIIAGAVTAGAIAGIVVGIALCIGLGGAGSYAVINKMGDTDTANIQNNPLFQGRDIGGNNPLARAT